MKPPSAIRPSKAQSSLEYLMTYGWAVIIIAVALSALYVFGVLNPSAFVSQQCLLPAGLSCTIVGMGTNGLITVNVYQSLGSQVSITSVACSTNDTFTNIPAYSGNQIVLRPGANATLAIQCYSGTSPASLQVGSVFTGYVILNYTQTSVSGFPHTVSGRVLAKTTYVAASTSVSTTSTTSTSTSSSTSTSTSSTTSSSTSTSTSTSSSTSTSTSSTTSSTTTTTISSLVCWPGGGDYTDCVTSSGVYYSSGSNAYYPTGSSWTTSSLSAPPGSAAGSPLSCWMNGDYLVCLTPSGAYYSSGSNAYYPTGSSWTAAGAPAPSGFSSGNPVSCWNGGGDYTVCITPSGVYYDSSSDAYYPTAAWTTASLPTPPGS